MNASHLSANQLAQLKAMLATADQSVDIVRCAGESLKIIAAMQDAERLSPGILLLLLEPLAQIEQTANHARSIQDTSAPHRTKPVDDRTAALLVEGEATAREADRIIASVAALTQFGLPVPPALLAKRDELQQRFHETLEAISKAAYPRPLLH